MLYIRPYVLLPGVSESLRLNISLTGIALDVPVAFLSGFSMLLVTPAATGADTEMNTTGISESILTIA